MKISKVFKNGLSVLTSLTMLASSVLITSAPLSAVVKAASDDVTITIDSSSERQAISPYIYGVDMALIDKDVAYGAVRAGGNRYTAYNWETNASNAGSDWYNNSDNYLISGYQLALARKPGAVALNLADYCNKKGAYSLMTLQMAGFVSADMSGEVTEQAPSSRWNKVEYSKGSAFSLTPDLNDGVVYMDEFVNYLVNELGDSQHGGINAYSLDNEPALWHSTHSLVHPTPTSCEELVERSIELANAVKKVDPNADIFGPALYGYMAYLCLQEAADWNTIQQNNSDYKWFVDYYLDKMHEAESTYGKRLLDVLDVHFYTEAQGACGIRYCTHYDDADCVANKLNATRSLWDPTYKEKSWIADTGAKFLPIIPALTESINTYYPGTKIAITEYDFGGATDVCGALCEADALGIFAKYGVYAANLFSGETGYQMAAINLYRNYDNNGGKFGDTLVSCESSNIEKMTSYAAINGSDDSTVTLVVTNKTFDSQTTANIKSNAAYNVSAIYGIDNTGASVKNMTSGGPTYSVSGNTISLTMEPMTVCLLVLTKSSETVTPEEATTPESTDKETTAQESTDKETTEKGSGIKLPLIIGISSVALLTLAAGAVLIIKRTKRNR
mgnify:CR=1 FL=1